MADIIVDTFQVQGPLPHNWQFLSQGGEETGRMFFPVLPQIKELSPKYIRIDHLYDFYGVVRRENGQLVFNWDALDQVVNDILQAGALPFFSLSYMPPAISQDGNVTSLPSNWEDWQSVVRETIEHFSGQGQRNLPDVYYEVWNEPDLFGRFSLSGEKSYLLLYEWAVKGADLAQNTNRFFIGGPATTAPYKNWLTGFLNYCQERNLRLDFLSWHRYSTDPMVFSQDLQDVDFYISTFPKFASLPKFITEWTIDSENNSLHDGPFAAVHTVAVVRQLLDGEAEGAFSFEIRDGLSPTGEDFWGRWGVLTYNGEKKPRYFALSLLNRLGRQRLAIQGEGTWVGAIGARTENRFQVLLYNLDRENSHFEATPLTFTNLPRGLYLCKEYPLTGEPIISNETVSAGTLRKEIPLNPNSLKLIEIEKVGPFYNFIQGVTEETTDQAVFLEKESEKISFIPPFLNPQRGLVDFYFKPLFSPTDEISHKILTISLSDGRRLSLEKRLSGFNHQLIFGIAKGDNFLESVEADTTNWKKDEWHKITLWYDQNLLRIGLDGRVVEGREINLSSLEASVLSFEPDDYALDNLLITDGEKTLIERLFDGRIDQ